MGEARLWTGPTRLVDPGWRAARWADCERALVPVVAWGVPDRGDLVPLGAGNERLDGPDLIHVAHPEMSDQELWAMLKRSAEVAREIEERMRREEATWRS